ncbi:hypothetical protein KFE25_004202 [Diacronema lutheri]|uniref:Glutathione S-transferase n=1 Tax=Diacronema lutheri TaxID=2081491 RepID=A0A8J5X434_DIALT|nr:hypothetical protein KFE25_004202 [Diacronema lutheri]
MATALLAAICALALPSGAAAGSAHLRLRGGLYKLTYFDARGAAELARIVLVASGAAWEDVRFPISMEGGKPNVPEFQKAKASGALALNMGRAPLLELDDGRALGQSRAIERFVARSHGLFGGSEFEGAQIDAILEHTRDVRDAYGRAVPAFGAETEDKAAKRAQWYAEALPDWLRRLEAALPPGGNNVAVGSSLSLADLAIWHLLRDYFADAEKTMQAASGCERLNAIADMVGAMPAISGWVAKRPQTAF